MIGSSNLEEALSAHVTSPWEVRMFEMPEPHGSVVRVVVTHPGVMLSISVNVKNGDTPSMVVARVNGEYEKYLNGLTRPFE